MRLLAWPWRHFRPVEGRFLCSLLLLAALSAALGGIAAEWVPGDELFWHTALIGALAGRVLGRTRIQGRWAAPLLVVGGATYVGWGMIHLTAPLWAVIRAAWRLDWLLVSIWLQEVGTRVAMLAGEMVAWVDSWGGQGRTPGTIVSLLWMALILWGGAAFAGWATARGHHPLRAFLPLGIVLAWSVYLGSAGTEYLLIFTTCVVTMTPLMVLRREEEQWNAQHMDYAEYIHGDTLMTALFAAVIFLAMAIIFPNVRIWTVVDWFWQQVQGPQQAAEEVLERAFPGARPATGGGFESGRVEATLPRAHLLGGSPDLDQTVVMLVTTDDPPPMPERIPYAEAAPRETHYWRGTAYFDYIGPGWHPGRTEATRQPPYAPLGPPERPGRHPLRQSFTLLVPHDETLYTAGDPHSVDQAVTVQRLPEGDDLIAVEGRIDSYNVLSLVSQVTARELAEAPTTYPHEIEAAYLALPSELPQRVFDLAQEVTAEADTPYARALALQAYLRSFPYDLEIARPPEGRDVVDYFLFELQRGYCDYFASAMVVMARSVGIPARLAVGYATGHYNLQRGAYVVTAKDGHAWPELYFPDYGWIPFEPTSGLQALERAENPEDAAAAQLVPFSLPERPWWVRLHVEARLIWLKWRWWLLAGVGILLAVGVAWRVRRQQPTGLSREERVALSYVRLRGMARCLEVPVHAWDTPAEFAATMARALARRRPHVAWLRAAMGSEVERALAGISLITKAYERASYAPTPPDADQVQRAWQEGQRLQWRLWRLRVLSVAGD